MIWRRHTPEERVQLAEDIRRLAGLADAAVGEAARLDAEIPEEVARCVASWRHWAGRLQVWAREEPTE
jgi:hypothetical protein